MGNFEEARHFSTTATSLSPRSSISARMAQPSSSHHGERHHRSDRDRERSHRHHRTISSTTLLLVLSLVLAVLAVMLSLPSGTGSSGEGSSMLSYLNPTKRTQALIARESAVASREAEVARREAELLAGAPGGVLPPSPPPVVCPACKTMTVTEMANLPAQTIIKEIVKEDSLAPPGWIGPRTEELLDRELKIAEREREIGKREENVNRREHDASRRESWIMEQLIVLGNDGPQTVEEEYVYEPAAKRKTKLAPIIAETQYETETKIIIETQTVTVPPPANTRLAPPPHPVSASSHSTPSSPRTTAVEIISEEVEEEDEDDFRSKSVTRGSRSSRRPPSRWFGGW
ncbi:hypothetical protein APHAL10511_001168 [Amanita phalloides]|nr:hypothetical protein APHAL10511_001168 [Amanita phalloides]